MNAAVASRAPWRLAGALAFVMLVPVVTLARRHAEGLRAAWPPEADTMYVPGSRVLRTLALGHRELFADLLAARTYVYFGTQITTKGAQKWLPRYLDTVADLDPYFPIYENGATMIVYNGQNFSVAGFEAANALIRRGLAVFPDNWQLWYALGFNNVYEIPPLLPPNDPRRAVYKRTGTEAFRRATLSPDSPTWFATAVSRMLNDEGDRDLAIRHLQRVYAITPDEHAREQIRLSLVHMLGERQADELDKARHAFDDFIARGYPYAPEAFTVVAGARTPRAAVPSTRDLVREALPTSHEADDHSEGAAP